MKIFTSFLALFLVAVTAHSQNCAHATSAFFTNPSGNGSTWRLTINWEANGQKHINVTVNSGASVILNTCLPVHNGTGTEIYDDLNAPGGIPSLSATLELMSGNCGGGASCGTTQVIPPGGGALPIKISSFYAKRNSNTVSLSWTSETEINSREYIIERNTGNGFVAVGTVAAVNNITGSSYSFTDQNLSKAVSQYRLKLVDIDAGYKYSEIKAIKGTVSVSDFTVYPNPSVGTAKVDISDISEATTVQLIDNAGRTVKTIELKNNSSVQLDGLQKGIYLVKISNKLTGDFTTKKLTVIN